MNALNVREGIARSRGILQYSTREQASVKISSPNGRGRVGGGAGSCIVRCPGGIVSVFIHGVAGGRAERVCHRNLETTRVLIPRRSHHFRTSRQRATGGMSTSMGKEEYEVGGVTAGCFEGLGGPNVKQEHNLTVRSPARPRCLTRVLRASSFRRYLYKKTRDGRWQKRWFETNGCFLTYYKVCAERMEHGASAWVLAERVGGLVVHFFTVRIHPCPAS